MFKIEQGRFAKALDHFEDFVTENADLGESGDNGYNHGDGGDNDDNLGDKNNKQLTTK